MNRILKPLLTIFLLFLLTGCTSNKNPIKDENIDKVINNIIYSYSNENLSKSSGYIEFVNQSNIIFSEYLSKNALDILAENRIVSIYYSTVNGLDVPNPSDIIGLDIKKSKEYERNNYIGYEYKISYKLKSKSETIDMVDYMSFKVEKDGDNLIDELYVLENSSIFEIYNTRLKDS